MVSQEPSNKPPKGTIEQRRLFRARVLRVLATLGVTQEEFAANFGLKRQAVSNWVNMKHLPGSTQMEKFEIIEARVTTGGQSADVEAVYQEGADFLRNWLRGYTTKALHAQAEAFGRNMDAAAVAATQSVADDAAAVGQPDAQTPARRKKSG